MLEFTWQPRIVTIQKGDIAPLGKGYSHIARCCWVTGRCGVSMDFYPFILGGQPVGYVHRAVGRAIINDKQFPEGVSLRHYRTYRLFEETFCIMHRHYYRHKFIHPITFY